MDRISVTLPEKTITRLSDAVEESYDSRSEAVRDLLEKGFGYDERVTELEAECNALEEEYEERITELEQEYEERITELEAEYENRLAELQERINELKTTTERLQNEKRLILAQREQNQELVEFVEEQRELTRYQERRQRLLDDANILRRWKWKLTGVPVDDSEE